MKFSNFKKLETKHEITFATVFVSSFFRSSCIRIVFKNSYNPNWRFLDTGKFTPNMYVEDLERQHNAQNVYNTL